jgi:hypothetical protein
MFESTALLSTYDIEVEAGNLRMGEGIDGLKKTGKKPEGDNAIIRRGENSYCRNK